MKKAVVAGSFDPFTNGHLDIVKRTAKIFDSVVILICKNTQKHRYISEIDMQEAIMKVIEREQLNNVICVAPTKPFLLAEYCKENDIQYSVRGLRNDMDFHYESNITETNRILNSNLETVYLPSTTIVSSSMVRELLFFNADISELVPQEIADIL